WPAWPRTHHTDIALAIGAVVAAAALVAGGAALGRAGRGTAVVSLGAALALVAVGVGWRAQGGYFAARYADDPIWRRARALHGAAIAVGGTDQQYPLYGLDLSNRVQYVGHRGPHGEFTVTRSCAEWRARLRRGGYRYVVTAHAVPEDEHA